jgi:hypothetical protein
MNIAPTTLEIPFKDFLQFQAHSGKTGLLEVDRDGACGRIYLHKGSVCHAVHEEEEGAAALKVILKWNEGGFRWFEGKSAPSMTLLCSIDDALIGSEHDLLEHMTQGFERQLEETRTVPSAVMNNTVRLDITSKEFPWFSHRMKTGEITVGRAGDNELVLPDTSVSRHHAKLIRHGASLVVRDLGSRNGTYLDGKLIHDGVLSPGRVLHIGEVRVVMALEPNS